MFKIQRLGLHYLPEGKDLIDKIRSQFEGS